MSESSWPQDHQGAAYPDPYRVRTLSPPPLKPRSRPRFPPGRRQPTGFPLAAVLGEAPWHGLAAVGQPAAVAWAWRSRGSSWQVEVGGVDAYPEQGSGHRLGRVEQVV